MKNAVILCSGGLDSVVTAHYVKKKLGYDKLIILFFNYGQKSRVQERKSAKKCSLEIGAKFIEIKLAELGKLSSSLINISGKIKKLERKDLKDTKKEAEKFYVPFRNGIFLAYALALAEASYIKDKKVYDIFVGFKCEGKEHYPDTTPEFISKINSLSKTTCAKPFKVIAPLIKKDKEDIIILGKQLGIKLEDTWSCYVSSLKNQCGRCLACMLRKEGFYWANVVDKTPYVV